MKGSATSTQKLNDTFLIPRSRQYPYIYQLSKIPATSGPPNHQMQATTRYTLLNVKSGCLLQQVVSNCNE